MRKLDDILKRASQLSAEERRKLVDSLEEGLAGEEAARPNVVDVSAFERWLSLAGTGHSDSTDVSSDKYKHLAAVYADGK
jgi:hypothetical protein